jgi:hypothetical protein
LEWIKSVLLVLFAKSLLAPKFTSEGL